MIPSNAGIGGVVQLLEDGTGFVFVEVVADGVGGGEDVLRVGGVDEDLLHGPAVVERADGVAAVVRVPVEAVRAHEDDRAAVQAVRDDALHRADFVVRRVLFQARFAFEFLVHVAECFAFVLTFLDSTVAV